MQKSAVLVIKIVVNDNFLSLSRNLMIPSLPCTEKELKREGNEVWYKNVIFKNYKDQLPNCLKR